MENFIAAIERRAKPVNDAQQAVYLMEMLDAIYLSSASGRRGAHRAGLKNVRFNPSAKAASLRIQSVSNKPIMKKLILLVPVIAVCAHGPAGLHDRRQGTNRQPRRRTRKSAVTRTPVSTSTTVTRQSTGSY